MTIKDGQLPYMKGANVMVSTSINMEMWQMAKKQGIRWHDALVRGLVMLSKGDRFQANLELQKQKTEKLSDLLFNTQQELEKANKTIKKLTNLLKSHNIRLDVLEEKKQEEATKK